MNVSYLNDDFFSRLETCALNLRRDLSGFFGGKHLVTTYGQTVEFADYREYMLGDDIRRIDWNLFSRFEKFFLKLFTDERDARSILRTSIWVLPVSCWIRLHREAAFSGSRQAIITG